VHCNLRVCGSALLLQASDNNGRTAMAYGGSSANIGDYPELAGSPQLGLYWMQYLQKQGYLSDLKSAACPSISPYRYLYDSGYTQQAYGLRRWRDTPYKPAATLQTVAKPTTYILLADSVIWPGGSQPAQFPGQRYYITTPGNKQDRIHARHDGRANLFFLDGSVRSLTGEEITDLDDGWDEKAIDDTNYERK